MENCEPDSNVSSETPDLAHLQSLINTLGLDLVKNGQAKFVYLDEGAINIVVFFEITDYSCNEPLMHDLITHFDKKVIRIKK